MVKTKTPGTARAAKTRTAKPRVAKTQVAKTRSTKTRVAKTRVAPVRPTTKKTTAATGAVVATKSVRVPRMPKAVTAAVDAALDKQALDVVVLDLRKAVGFTDYFIVCTGTNPRQIAAIADAVQTTLKQDLGERPTLAEGKGKSEWILLDYFDFVVHVFGRDCRAFYGLEGLWGNAERYEFPAQPPSSSAS